MTLGTYETFIAKSRYSRFLDDKHRREHWPETVDRYMNFMQKQLQKKHSYTMPPSLRDELHSAILNCEVMPSMRAMMTAGEALDRDNTAGYNCSYLPVDDVKSFDEAMYILLCGTGVGFSVESKYVNKLPEVPSKMFNSDTTIVVSDSKAGWAKALRQLVALLYSGEIPKWDTSKVLAAGARLKVFGGRASGPQPLVSLFEFVTNKFKGAAGRKLTSLEYEHWQTTVHAIMTNPLLESLCLSGWHCIKVTVESEESSHAKQLNLQLLNEDGETAIMSLALIHAQKSSYAHISSVILQRWLHENMMMLMICSERLDSPLFSVPFSPH